MGTLLWTAKEMSPCGSGTSCWDPEVGENGFKTRSRTKHAKRERKKMDALKEKNEHEAFEVPDTFCCAKYEPERVGLILAKRGGKARKAPWGKFLSWINPFKFRPFLFSIQRMVWFPAIFLLLYYIVQWQYQADKGLLCPRNIWSDTECAKSPNPNTSLPLLGRNGMFQLAEKEHTKCCRKWTKKKYEEWGERATKLSSLLTFLLGFYVARIVSSWWSQVCGIPDIDNLVLMFAGLASSENHKFTLPLRRKDANQNTETSYDSSTDFPRAVLEAEKMIARYGLLSWTLCFNTMSPIFRKEFGTFEKLKEKGLLHPREQEELKAVSKTSDKVSCELWSTPLTWAVTLMKEIGPNGRTYEQDGKEKENQRIIPKDHKDMLACLLKFKAALDLQKAKSDNSLPNFYKHVLKWALFAFSFFAVFFSQHTLHHTEWNLGFYQTLVYNFPGSSLITLIALHAWLSMTAVLDNPYSGNLLHDINLEEELELRIWGSSLAIEQQNLKSELGTLTNGDEVQKKLWELIKP